MKRKIQDCLAYRLFLLLPLFSFGGCVEIKAPVDYVNPYMGKAVTTKTVCMQGNLVFFFS